jgi:hypothetical protein
VRSYVRSGKRNTLWISYVCNFLHYAITFNIPLSALSSDTFLCWIWVSSDGDCFKATYCHHLQGRRLSQTGEQQADLYQTTRRHIPEGSTLHVRVKVHMAVTMNTIFWVVTPCSSKTARGFGENMDSIFRVEEYVKEVVACFCRFFARFILRLWMRGYVPPKRQYIYELHGVTIPKTALFNVLRISVLLGD